MKTLQAVLLTAVMAGSAWAQTGVQPVQPCPIAIPRMLTHGVVSEYQDTDPWHSYLRIKVVNTTAKVITAIRFGVAFTDSFGTPAVSVFAHSSDETIKPGKFKIISWADGVEAGNAARRTGAIVWMEKVLFADGSVLVDDGTHTCGAMTGPQQGIEIRQF